MAGTDLISQDTDARLDALARRYAGAGGLGIRLLNLAGGQAENLLERLPDTVKDRLEEATERALRVALRAARDSRRIPGPLGRSLKDDPAPWVTTAVTTAMGAAGGWGGLPTALAELPMTTTVLLRAIQAQALRAGFDATEAEVEAQCLQVFAAAGPLKRDDGADTGFLAARVTLTGPALNRMIAAVAPRLSVVLGQKLAAQAVPVLGAAAGAATNFAYSRYYQEVAAVQFGLIALSRDSGIATPDLVERLRLKMPPRAGD